MTWWSLVSAALLLGACTFGSDPAPPCRADEDCDSAGACRDGVCIWFATPLDEPVDPRQSPDAGDAAP